MSRTVFLFAKNAKVLQRIAKNNLYPVPLKADFLKVVSRQEKIANVHVTLCRKFVIKKFVLKMEHD